MEYLSYWLLFVASLRLLSVLIGYFSPFTFRAQLFNRQPDQVTTLQARSFAVWTLLTCSLCIICAFNLNEYGIYLATTISFYVAFGFFVLEFFVYKTLKVNKFIQPGIVATVSALWMTTRGFPTPLN